MYVIQPPYTGGVTMRVRCMAVYGLYGAVCMYAQLYGTGAQVVGRDSPSNMKSTPRAHGDVNKASHGIHSVMVV